MSLLDAAERFASIDRSSVTLDTKRCLHTQDRYSTCVACQDLCPVGAIKPGKPPGLQSEACVSCLACLPACPVGAFQADDAVAALLNCVTRLETDSIELVCEKHGSADAGTAGSGAIRVRGCLAGLGSGAYLMLTALGIQQVIVRTDACSSCQWSGLSGQVAQQISVAQQLLKPWGNAECIACAFELENPVERLLWDASNPPLSRRDLFRLVAWQGQVAMARAMEKKASNADKATGRDRRRLLGAFEHLPETRPGLPTSLEGLGFANITVSEACTACSVCANACPAHALVFEKADDESSFALTFSARACIGCEACGHVCAPSAITIDHAPLFDQVFGRAAPVTVRTGRLARCARCHALVAERDGTTLCVFCEARSKNPFGSLLPRGMKIPERLAKGKSGS